MIVDKTDSKQCLDFSITIGSNRVIFMIDEKTEVVSIERKYVVANDEFFNFKNIYSQAISRAYEKYFNEEWGIDIDLNDIILSQYFDWPELDSDYYYMISTKLHKITATNHLLVEVAEGALPSMILKFYENCKEEGVLTRREKGLANNQINLHLAELEDRVEIANIMLKNVPGNFAFVLSLFYLVSEE